MVRPGRPEPSTASVVAQLVLMAVAAGGLAWSLLVALATLVGFPFTPFAWADASGWRYGGILVAAAAVVALYVLRARQSSGARTRVRHTSTTHDSIRSSDQP